MGKRGRPPKKPSIAAGERSPSEASAKEGKKRGRPPKTNDSQAMQNLRVSARSETVSQREPEVRARESASSNGEYKAWSAALRLSQAVSDQYAMTQSEQKLAFDCALVLQKGAVMVELGVTYGRTAIILCYAASVTGAHYFGIDNFRMGSSQDIVCQALNEAGVSGTILKGDTNTVKWDKKIDYLLIDAGHDDLNMRQDTARWLPFLNPGGLVLFHAYNPDIDYSDPHFPVKRFAEERTPGWQEIAYIPYLLVKQKPLQ